MKSTAQRTPPCLHHAAPPQSHFLYISAATPPRCRWTPPSVRTALDCICIPEKSPRGYLSGKRSTPHRHFTHSANNLCFGAPRPAAKSAITPGWAFRWTDGPTSLLIKRRFSQIFNYFRICGGWENTPPPSHPPIFEQKKLFASHHLGIFSR